MGYKPHRLEPNYRGPEVMTTKSPAPSVVVSEMSRPKKVRGHNRLIEGVRPDLHDLRLPGVVRRQLRRVRLEQLLRRRKQRRLRRTALELLLRNQLSVDLLVLEFRRAIEANHEAATCPQCGVAFYPTTVRWCSSRTRVTLNGPRWFPSSISRRRTKRHARADGANEPNVVNTVELSRARRSADHSLMLITTLARA